MSNNKLLIGITTHSNLVGSEKVIHTKSWDILHCAPENIIKSVAKGYVAARRRYKELSDLLEEYEDSDGTIDNLPDTYNACIDEWDDLSGKIYDKIIIIDGEYADMFL
ncbi:MAG: hypothetical protein OQK82_03695 [Candidatus Pacearchaeota archaeon]|nr:hypothetical protein [Candidatus Pacearchaeota archaeon]